MRVGIVGTGNVARRNYLPFLSGVEDVELVYHNRTMEKAQACADEFGGTVASSMSELVETDPDTIMVLTAETCRYEVVMELLSQRPKRLFFEKPLVAARGQDKVSPDDFLRAKELLETAQEMHTETAMVFNYRFFDSTRRALETIEERGFGALTQASLFVNYACWSHSIDLLRVFGGPATTISSIAGTREFAGAVDVAAAFDLEHGATGTILGTNATSFDYSLFKIILSFEEGMIELNDLDGPMYTYKKGERFVENHTLTPVHYRWDQYAASFVRATSAYIDSVRENTPPPVPGRAGLEELQFEAALRTSIAEGRPVDVQREFPLDGVR